MSKKRTCLKGENFGVIGLYMSGMMDEFLSTYHSMVEMLVHLGLCKTREEAMGQVGAFIEAKKESWEADCLEDIRKVDPETGELFDEAKRMLTMMGRH